MAPITFTSKIDPWVPVVTLGALLPACFFLGSLPRPAALLALALLFVVAAFVIWVLAGTEYRLEDGRLRILCGPLRWTIPLADIRSVEPTRDLASGPALSLDRLRIVHGRQGHVMRVSPLDQAGFLRALEARR